MLRALAGASTNPGLPVTYHDAQKQRLRPDGYGKRRALERILWAALMVCVLAPTAVFALYQRSKAPAEKSLQLNEGSYPATQSSFPASHLENLVLVAGHAVYTGVDYSRANKEASWFLEEYQKVPGEAQSFIYHIRLGVEEAAKDPSALLLFSGGQTREEAGPRSEGMSYWVVAEAAQWFNASREVRARAYTEEHARDSFENLLFSMCRFYELTGHYPQQVTVVSYTLKRRRFEELHRAALHFPASRFAFVGTDVPPAAKGATAGEAKTVAAFMADPYGCSAELRAKKQRRDPFRVGPPHPSRCPGIAPLLSYCSSKLYDGQVPWDSTGSGGSSRSGGGHAVGLGGISHPSGGSGNSDVAGVSQQSSSAEVAGAVEGVPGPHGSMHMLRGQVAEVTTQ